MTWLQNTARYLLSLAVLVILWAALASLTNTPSYVLPRPSQVFWTLLHERYWFAGHARATAVNWLAGASLGVFLGVAVGGGLALHRRARLLIEPVLIIFQSFPREALIPVIVVWLGFGSAPKIFNAAMLSFFPMAIVTMHSLLDARREYVELVQSWGASRFEELIYCRVPCAVQPIISALKVSVPLALIGAVIGEFMGGNAGLGYVIISTGARFRMDRSFAALVVLGAFGVLSLALIRILQDIVFRRFKQG